MPDWWGEGGTVPEWLRPDPWTITAANGVLLVMGWVYILDLEPIGPPASTPNLLATAYFLGLLLLVRSCGRHGESTIRQVWKRNLLVFLAVLMTGYLPPLSPLVDEMAVVILVHSSFLLALLALVFLVQRARS